MYLRLLRLCAFAAFVLLLPSAGATAEKRVALIIGNSIYTHADTLTNPDRDAQSIADMLRAPQARFDVVEEYKNLDNKTLHRVVRGFAKRTHDADVAVVYYAGHGVQHDGQNFLVPTDALLENDQDIEEESLSLDRVLATIKAAKRLRIVILDACRNTPFDEKIRGTAKRSYSKGLAIVEPTMSGTVIAFAAKGGTTAEDGDGAHSPFTTALLQKLMTPGISIRTTFDIVRDEVKRATRGRQEPFTVYSLDNADKAELIPSPATPPRVAEVARSSDVEREYDHAERIGTPEAWDVFVEHFNGLPQAKFYLDLARVARAKAVKIEKQREDERAARLLEAKAQDDQQKKAEEARQAEAARKQAEARAEEARQKVERAETQRAEEARKQAALAAAAEEARKKADLAKAAEGARKAALLKAAEETRKKAEETRRAEIARKKAEDALRAEQARREIEIVKRVEEEARKKTMVASVSPTTQMRASSKLLESKAQDFLDDYINQSQGGLEDVTAYSKRAYAAEVDYFGSRLHNAQIVNEQRNYVKTWPERTFQVRAGTTRIVCDAAASACDLAGEIDFHDVNPAKSKSSTGVASFELRVSFGQTEPKIVSENGKVISRQK